MKIIKSTISKIVFSIFLIHFLSACQDGNLDSLEEEISLGALDIVSIDVTAPAALDDKMPLNETLQFIATGNKSDGSTVDVTTLETLTWSVSDTNVATIDNSNSNSKGVLTSTAVAGSVTVSANISTIADSEIVEISDLPLSLILVNTYPIPSTDVSICSEQQLSAVGTYGAGTESFEWDITKKVDWSTTTGVVIDYGVLVIKTIAVNPAQVTATLGTVSNDPAADINIVDDLDSITITPVSPEVTVDSTVELTATAVRNNELANDMTLLSSWSSELTNIATVDEITGVVTGRAVGSSSITATCGGKNSSRIVSVLGSDKLERIEIVSTPATEGFYSVKIGVETQLSVTAFYPNSEIAGIEDDIKTTYVPRNIDGSPITINSTGLVSTSIVDGIGIAEVVVTYAPNGLDGTERTDDVVFKVVP